MAILFATELALDSEVQFVLFQHRGQGNAIGRWDLVRRVFGVDAARKPEDEADHNPYDRRLRRSIERLRPMLLICNLGDQEGYFLATNRDEYEAWKRYYLGPSYSKFETVQKTDERADELFGKQAKHPDPLPLFAGVGG